MAAGHATGSRGWMAAGHATGGRGWMAFKHGLFIAVSRCSLLFLSHDSPMLLCYGWDIVQNIFQLRIYVLLFTKVAFESDSLLISAVVEFQFLSRVLN
jgi:hypothetical protein